MLRVLEKARPKCAIEISSTFCGAHSVPKGSTAAQVGSHQVYFYLKKHLTLCPREAQRPRVVSHYIDYNRLEGNLIHSGDNWCDRKTTPSSFEAQKGRSVLTSPLEKSWKSLFPGQLDVENIDVFCEKGVFEVEDSKRILEVSLDTEQGYMCFMWHNVYWAKHAQVFARI